MHIGTLPRRVRAFAVFRPGGRCAPARPFPWTLAACAVVATYAVVSLATVRQYGITWDEQWRAWYGEMVIAWYRSGFTDARALEYWILPYYGGLFDAAAQAAWRFSPWSQFETRHLASAACAVLGAAGTYRLGAALAGPRTGALAALFLVLTPRWYGHGFFNPVDVPFAAATVWAVDSIVRLVPRLPRPPWWMLLRAGVLSGAAMGIRFGGVQLLGLCGLAMALWLAARRRSDAPPRLLPLAATLSARLAAVCAVAWATMLAGWPAAQVSPWSHPWRSLVFATEFPWTYDVRFAGADVAADRLPRDYFVEWLLISLPEFLLLGVMAATAAAVLALLRGHHASWIGWSVLAASVVVPLAFQAATHAVVYDGMRHALFVVPPLAVAAGAGVSALLGPGTPRPLAVAAGVAVAASATLTAADMVRLHPYQHVFFNRALAGGLPGAASRYETDYWGSSYREGAEWIAARYRPAAGGRPLRVASCSARISTEPFLAPGFVHVNVDESPDLFLATTRWGCHRTVDGRVVHVVRRMGVPLLYVKEVTPAR